MSYQGQSPKVNRLRLQPRSSDPGNAAEGDLQYADGTVRDEGLWVYKNGAWTSVVDAQGSAVKLRFIPQSADPSNPQVGDVFYADGTSRAEGLWVYQGGAWTYLSGNNFKEFSYKKIFNVKAASPTSTSFNLSSLAAGLGMDGITLVVGNFVLLKSQSTNSENGVYVIDSSAPPIRHADFDSASELSFAAVAVESGNTNANKIFTQNNELTSLSSTQSWAEATAGARAANLSFVVPSGVNAVSFIGSGGGAGGGGGVGTYYGGGGAGSGGGAATPLSSNLLVTPGETLTIALGSAGRGGATGASGTVGGDTIVYRGATAILRMPGATNPGNTGSNTAGAGAISAVTSTSYSPLYMIAGPSGAGGNGEAGALYAGNPGGNTMSSFSTANGGYGGAGPNSLYGGGGGAGGCGFGSGGRGGHGGGGSSSRGDLGSWIGTGSTVSRANNITTVTIATSLLTAWGSVPLVVGDKVVIAGCTPTSFNGTWTVLSVGASSFTIYNPGANASVSVLGSCVQSTYGHNGIYGSGGGGGGGNGATPYGIWDAGKPGGWGGMGFIRFTW